MVDCGEPALHADHAVFVLISCPPMNLSSLTCGLWLIGGITLSAFAQGDALTPTIGLNFPVVGKVAPRSAKEIASSSWSVGGETLDRDFTVYEHYKKYVGPLGAKGIRLQAGWAKCERQPGVYDFAWLDAVIDDARAQSVQPWLEFSYSNPLYPGVGDTGLGGGFPSTPEALAAWDRWVRALVVRYGDRVYQWEVWNEPDLNSRGTATVEAYVELYIRTAKIVRELQPDTSRLYALALAHVPEYAERFLDLMRARGRLDLIDAITLHGYPNNPDQTSIVDRLRAYMAPMGRTIQIRQGETGAPSRIQEYFALRNITWTENTQAKWDLRRLLAHHAKDVPMNLFTMADMHYRQGNNTSGRADGILRMNYKGLLGTNPDQTISHIKLAYYAAQRVFSIFDDSLPRITDYPFTSTALRGVALSGYARQPGGGQVVAYWFNDAPPAEVNGVNFIDLTLPKGRFTDPVVVDLRTGAVHSLPTVSWSQDEHGAVFRGLPVYDSPLLLAEKSGLPLVPTAP